MIWAVNKLVIGSPVNRDLSSSQFWIMLWTLEYKCLHRHMILCLLGKYSGVKLLDHMVSVYFILKCQNIFTVCLYYFALRPAMYKSSSCFTNLTKLGIVSVFNFSHSSECVMVFHFGFNFYFSNDWWCWTAF